MKIDGEPRNQKFLKLVALLIAAMIILSSIPVFVRIEIPNNTQSENHPKGEINPDDHENDVRTPLENRYQTSEWNNLSDYTSPDTPPEVNVTESNSQGIEIVTDINGFWRGNITLDGIEYDTINIPGTGSKTVPGEPAIPRISMYLEVPHDVDISLDVTYIDYVILDGFKVNPYQTPSVSLPNISRIPFVFDSVTNTTNAFYPYLDAQLNGDVASSSIIMRGRRLVVLNLYPIQFNPVTGQLKSCRLMEIQLTYSEEAEIQPVNAALYSEVFEDLFQSFTLNFVAMEPPQFNTTPSFSILPNDYVLAQSSTEGFEYLIIVYDEFYSAAMELAEWKTRKGVPTAVVKTSDIFGDENRINELDYEDLDSTDLNSKISALKLYMEEVFQTWVPVPTYVLLFGDSEHIPCDYSIPHTAKLATGEFIHGDPEDDPSVNKIATDATYFIIQGIGHWPDFIHGRISVNTALEAQRVVNKIISYETEPTDIEQFYTDVLASTYFQDKYFFTGTTVSSDGWEDEDFVGPVEDVSEYLMNRDYIIHKEYSRYGTVEPEHLYDYSRSPPEVSWDATTSTIITNINEGRFLVYHTDHGSSMNLYVHGTDTGFGGERGVYDGWSQPRFTTDDISSLSNPNLLPFILSMECCTGWFDGETDGFIDPDLAYDANSESIQYTSFAESITRKESGGAIGIIAPTRTSFNVVAGELMRGIIDAIWPGMLCYLFLEVEIEPIYNLGAALRRGKLYIQTQYESEIDIESATEEELESLQEGIITMLIYQLFGDPETPLWTQFPRTLEGAHSNSIGLGSQDFEISVTDEYGVVEGADVCLWKDSEIYERWKTDENGLVSIPINPETAGTLKITVTKHNSRPYQMDISVTDGLFDPLCITIGMGILAIIAMILLCICKKKSDGGN